MRRRLQSAKSALEDWLFDSEKPGGETDKHKAAWWQVMCLTGVDYFSTLGYQPGIAFLAAGVLSPMATLVLVAVTLLGALPAYCLVARESPHGQGSISMLERLMSGWQGKTIVLVLLGFVATAFFFTITISTSDAAAHIVENPLTPEWFGRNYRIQVTIMLLLSLVLIFIRGFKEAIGIAVLIVFLYLLLNVVLIGCCLTEIITKPVLAGDWWSRVSSMHDSVFNMVVMSACLFPKLALGLSGFETGVAVMPLVKGNVDDKESNPKGRIRNTRNLLVTAAITMSIFLIGSSFITTVLIPAELFQDGQSANGRALAYLAHLKLGHVFGTVYDVTTIVILWFAGASAITGLLTLFPLYLPRYGMAPDWARALRPLVLIIAVISILVIVVFKADVDAQAGAYATGVLVMITSAAIAAALSIPREQSGKKGLFCVISAVFIYTTIANVVQQVDGLGISFFFIGMVIVTSFISRAIRSTELRIAEVKLDETALQFIKDAIREGWGEIRILAHRPDDRAYLEKERHARRMHSIQKVEGNFIFFEVDKDDASEFIDQCLDVEGRLVDGNRILRCKSPSVPNALAALLLHIRDKTKKVPHVYLKWTEGHPVAYAIKFVFWGEGETAALTREILRRAEGSPEKRPYVHVS